MRRLTLGLLFCFLLLSSGCWSGSDRTTGPADSDSHANSASRVPRHLDHVVLDAVLHDLLQYSGDDSPVVTKGKAPKDLTFDVSTPAYAQTTEDVLYEYRAEPWRNLKADQIGSVRLAADDLVRRIESEDFVVGFKPASIRVLLTDSEQYGRRGFKAWPPGFSADKRLAIVRMVLPWSIHSAEGTYILEKNGDDWIVVLRQFVYYP